MSLSQKIASKYLASQPLRLQPDYGERASNLANLYAKNSADFLADDLFAEDHEAEDWMASKEADFDKYSKVKSHKHHSPKDVKDSYEAQKKNFGDEWEKYEGAMTEEGISEAVVQENLEDMGKSASQMVREDFIDAKGKSGGLHDEIKVGGKKFFVSNIFYDLGRREIFVSYMDGRKQRSAPASEVVITKADPYRRASDEIIDDIGLGRIAGDESSGSYMSRQNLREIEDMSGYVLDHIENHEEDLELDDWVEDKISQGRSMVDDVYRHVTYGDKHRHHKHPHHKHHDDDEIIDDLGLNRMASDEIIDDIGLGRSLKRRRQF